MSFSIMRLLGFNKEPPFTEVETKLLIQLQTNRKIATERIIPEDMKQEFLTSIYSDKGLKQIVKEIYRKQFLTENKRMWYLKLLIAGHIGIHGFGIRFILHHGVDPEIISRTMLNNIDI